MAAHQPRRLPRPSFAHPAGWGFDCKESSCVGRLSAASNIVPQAWGGWMPPPWSQQGPGAACQARECFTLHCREPEIIQGRHCTEPTQPLLVQLPAPASAQQPQPTCGELVRGNLLAALPEEADCVVPSEGSKLHDVRGSDRGNVWVDCRQHQVVRAQRGCKPLQEGAPLCADLPSPGHHTGSERPCADR